MPYATRAEDLNYGRHLDNLRILRAADEARSAFLGLLSLGLESLAGEVDLPAETAPFVVGYRVAFARELNHVPGRPLETTTWVCRLGRTSATLATEVRQAPGEPVGAQVETTIVFVDVAAGAPTEPGERTRERLAAYLGPSLAFRD